MRLSYASTATLLLLAATLEARVVRLKVIKAVKGEFTTDFSLLKPALGNGRLFYEVGGAGPHSSPTISTSALYYDWATGRTTRPMK